MRLTRTPLEQSAIDALLGALEAAGQCASADPEITDSPDALLNVDGISVAVECRILTPERVLRLHGLRMLEGEVHSLSLPIEPHMWLAAALKAKNPKVPAYRAKSGAEYVALLLHSSSMFDRGAYESHKDFYTTALVHGLALSESNFDAVLFADEHSKEVLLLTDQPSPLRLPVAPQQKVKLTGLPILRQWFVHSTATEGPNGQGTVTVGPIMIGGPRAIALQPLDHHFLIDYPSYYQTVADASAKGETLPYPKTVLRKDYV